MILSNSKSIQLLQDHAFQFANGLDQQIHGIDYDIQLSKYQAMMDDLMALMKDPNLYLEIVDDSKILLEKNLNYFLKNV